MLQITRTLQRHFNDKKRVTLPIDSYCAIISSYGNIDDANVLVKLFLDNPTDYKSRKLLTPIMILGDSPIADTLYRQCFTNGKLNDGYPSEILYCLGYLGYPLIQTVCMHYLTEGDYFDTMHAALGLLHFDCTDYRTEIKREIDKCFGNDLFNEFAPSLAIKTGDTSLKEKLYQLGSTTASSDCLTGILLGITLFNDRELFKKILWDERWEAVDTGTGNRYWTYIGCMHLGITFHEMFTSIKETVQSASNTNEMHYRCRVLLGLLDMKITDPQIPLRFVQENRETYESIYITLYEWSDPNNDDSITGITGKVLKNRELQSYAYELFRRLELKVRQELLEKCFIDLE